MPQTSLLSFLASSVVGNVGSLPLKPTNAALENTKVKLTPNHISAGTGSKTHLVPRKSLKWIGSTDLDHQGQASSVLTNVQHKTGTKAFWVRPSAEEVEGTRKLGDPATTISLCPATSLHPASGTVVALPDIPSITITSIQSEQLPALKRLTSALLPIKYPETFFNQVIDDETTATISRAALCNLDSSSPPTPIGWIRCSLEPYPEGPSPPQISHPTYNQIYIKTICLLAPYRNMGIATALLDCILQQVKAWTDHNIRFIFAHVWESNEEALEWYGKRGFRKEIFVQGYYRRLRPAGAWIVRKQV